MKKDDECKCATSRQDILSGATSRQDLLLRVSSELIVKKMDWVENLRHHSTWATANKINVSDSTDANGNKTSTSTSEKTSESFLQKNFGNQGRFGSSDTYAIEFSHEEKFKAKVEKEKDEISNRKLILDNAEEETSTNEENGEK